MLKGIFEVIVGLNVALWRKLLAGIFVIITIISTVSVFSVISNPHPAFCGNTIFTSPWMCVFSVIMVVGLLFEF